ncbi:MAG: hypothetical protein OH319_01820 [Candidatus Parvarchaeota archaeon]|nr:hypothetical protein [Candidatus Jingweiarchaeum tengchongense]MCW1298107.1 hypothetical protein [Candidatus Jingweiarchaeum tengchongense]MCW1300715.1 hypothetical protein [Candidatus Jingweiarchaeum tengchongense]MCW1305140.1 hypothetical protein [Candidatus Jingweiarchaeum tengchongense]MCW1305529.1 hypothetical protein [Candidatus Jingweiarchaeum tengchongense]
MNTRDLEAYELGTIVTITGSLLIGSGWVKYDQTLLLSGAAILCFGFGMIALFFKANNKTLI